MEYLCDYGNCQETKDGKRMITITNNVGANKRRFCSWQHAAAFCLELVERERVAGDQIRTILGQSGVSGVDGGS